MSSSTERPVLADLRAEELGLADVQQLAEIVVRAYGRLVDTDQAGSLLPAGHRVTATEVALAASALLDAVHLEVFELALWATWGGRPWSASDTRSQNRQDAEDAHA